MYRLITESLLGLHLQVDKLRVTPCMPDSWTSFQVHYRYRETVYHITVVVVDSAAQPCRVLLDGVELSTDEIPLHDDRRDHRVEISLGRD